MHLCCLDNLSSFNCHSLKRTPLPSIHWQDGEYLLGAHCPVRDGFQVSTEFCSSLEKANRLPSNVVSRLLKTIRRGKRLQRINNGQQDRTSITEPGQQHRKHRSSSTSIVRNKLPRRVLGLHLLKLLGHLLHYGPRTKNETQNEEQNTRVPA